MEYLKSVVSFPSFTQSAKIQEEDSESREVKAAAMLNTINHFFQNNYRPLITAFLLYFVALGSITHLKGKELLAASAGSAAWTVVHGSSALGLAATAPVVYGVAKMLFNWATTPSATLPMKQAAPVFMSRPQSRTHQEAVRDPLSHDAPQDFRVFEEAWQAASQKLQHPQTFVSPSLVSQHQKDGDRRLQMAQAIASPLVKPLREEAAEEVQHDANPRTQTTHVFVNPNLTSSPVHGSLEVNIEDGERATSPVHEPASPATANAPLDTEVDLEAAWESAEQSIAAVNEEAPPQMPVKEAKKGVEKSPFDQKMMESRRIAWELAAIASETQRAKMPKEISTFLGMVHLRRDQLFRALELTPKQYMILLLPSVLTESQKGKITDLDLRGRCQAVEHFQSKFLEFLELTPEQKRRLTLTQQSRL